MSLLRFAVPGRPVVIIDEGPNLGRVTGTGGAALESGSAYKPRREPPRHDTPAVPRPMCGKPMRVGTCARNPNHGWDCKTATSLARDAARRRTHPVVRLSPEEIADRRRAYFREWQRERRMLGLR